MDKKRKNYVEVKLTEILRAIWSRAWVVILAVAVCGGAAFSYAAFFITPLYQASTLMYVNNSAISVGSTSVSISPGQLTAAQHLVDTYVVILKTRATLTRVLEEAELNYSYGQLYRMVQAAQVGSTEIFEVRVTSPHPGEAARIANTIADVLPDQIADIVDGASVRVVDYAVAPSRPVYPNVARDTVLGMLLGFLLSCAGIAVYVIFDTTIHSADYLVQNWDLPLLAVIPEHSPRKRGLIFYRAKLPGETGENPMEKEIINF